MMAAEQRIPVFVISLARAPERRKAIQEHLTGLGIEFRLIDAVDRKTLSDERIQELVAQGRRMHPGAVGCYLSHLKVYEAMRDEQIPAALVLEDDARVNPRLAGLLREGLGFDDWDYCFLDGDGHNEKGRIFYDVDSEEHMGSGFRCYRLSDGPQTTHAYMITRPAAIKRLEHAYPLVKAIDIYDHLPYEIRFRAIVSPKAAWVSEHSLESFTSKRSVSQDQLSLGWLRRWALFYKIKDLIKLRGLKDYLEVRRLKEQGILAGDRKWKAIPFDRQILLR